MGVNVKHLKDSNGNIFYPRVVPESFDGEFTADKISVTGFTSQTVQGALQELNNKDVDITVDSALSSTSVNPVQNKVVNQAYTELLEQISNNQNDISTLAPFVITISGENASSYQSDRSFTDIIAAIEANKLIIAKSGDETTGITLYSLYAYNQSIILFFAITSMDFNLQLMIGSDNRVRITNSEIIAQANSSFLGGIKAKSSSVDDVVEVKIDNNGFLKVDQIGIDAAIDAKLSPIEMQLNSIIYGDPDSTHPASINVQLVDQDGNPCNGSLPTNIALYKIGTLNTDGTYSLDTDSIPRNDTTGINVNLNTASDSEILNATCPTTQDEAINLIYETLLISEDTGAATSPESVDYLGIYIAAIQEDVETMNSSDWGISNWKRPEPRYTLIRVPQRTETGDFNYNTYTEIKMEPTVITL